MASRDMFEEDARGWFSQWLFLPFVPVLSFPHSSSPRYAAMQELVLQENDDDASYEACGRRVCAECSV